MLDGLRGASLPEFQVLQRQMHELETALRRRLDAQDTKLEQIDAGQQALLDGVRTLLEHRAQAGITCPAVFSIRTASRTPIRRRPR